MTDLTKLTIEEASQALDAGDFDAVDLFAAYQARIERLEPNLNCFITLTMDVARKAAEASAARVKFNVSQAAMKYRTWCISMDLPRYVHFRG